MTGRSRRAPSCALLTALTVAACGGEPADVEPAARAKPPVILISVDTLRADRLPAYGYRGVETPHVDALRRDSILFARAYSPVPLTFPSHASVLTGLLPAGHGVRDNLGFSLDPSVASLPRILKADGYATGAAVSAVALLSDLGIGEGFDFYEDRFEWSLGEGLGEIQRPGHETLARSTQWLESVAGRPFFFFFHIYEPHTPRSPPEPFASRYGASYDGEVAAADDVVGALVRELRRLGVYDRSLIVFLSDHGEGLGDHGEDEHGIFLYRESLEVPLMVKLPGSRRGGETVAAPAQLIDVFPTVLGFLGLPVPPTEGAAASRTSLLELEETTDRRLVAETFYPRLHFGWSELFSVVAGRFHFISGPDPELYDLAADPAETKNLLGDERATAQALHDFLAAEYDPRFTAPGAIDPQRRKALAALGYLGGSASAAAGPLPDPKTRIHTLDDLARGFGEFREGRYEEAAASLAKVVEANPRLVDAWEYLARSLHNAGRKDEALKAYLTAIDLAGAAPASAAPAAVLLAEQGRTEEALALLAEQIRLSPRSARLRSLEVRLLLGADRAKEALERLDELAAIVPDDAGVLYQRGIAEMLLGSMGDAEVDLRRAIELDPRHVAALHDLAVLLMREERWAEAEGLLERVLELKPDDPLAPRHLERVRRELAAGR